MMGFVGRLGGVTIPIGRINPVDGGDDGTGRLSCCDEALGGAGTFVFGASDALPVRRPFT